MAPRDRYVCKSCRFTLVHGHDAQVMEENFLYHRSGSTLKLAILRPENGLKFDEEEHNEYWEQRKLRLTRNDILCSSCKKIVGVFYYRSEEPKIYLPLLRLGSVELAGPLVSPLANIKVDDD